MILSESTFIGLVGGAVGCVIAVALSLGIAQFAHHGSPYMQSSRSFSLTPLGQFLTILAVFVISVGSAFFYCRLGGKGAHCRHTEAYGVTS
jgi:ABC-type antimicrobial peptide transport system permease subunit